jgi:hypothetical protein
MHEIVRLIADAKEGRFLSPEDFARAMEQELWELERNARVIPDTALLNPADEDLQHYMRASLLVITALIRVSLDPTVALRYFRYLPVGELADKTPEMLVAHGQTVDLLLRLEA